MANTIRMRLELLGFAELNAVITAESRFTTGTLKGETISSPDECRRWVKTVTVSDSQSVVCG